LASFAILIGALASAWWLYRAERSTAEPPPPLLLTGEPHSVPAQTAPAAVTEKPPEPVSIEAAPPVATSKPTASERMTSLLDAGRAALARNDTLEARSVWNEALRLGGSAEQAAFLRAELGRIADETILSAAMVAGDPLVERYVIRTGDVLAKIAAANRISPDLLAIINGMADKNLIREGQTIKVVKGPFRAVVRKSEYRLDVFLGDVFVRQYKVGLGADDSTPTGEWRVSTKLVNPTYYPPRGGKIVSADDPENPLGERWIGLVGLSGEALDQQRYGIHGTNEPDSIGKSVSMGCIRMHNADVEQVYAYLVEAHSRVAVFE
jgi:lipoprotein-anchoring transpeptidase ErfK/SrfK